MAFSVASPTPTPIDTSTSSHIQQNYTAATHNAFNFYSNVHPSTPLTSNPSRQFLNGNSKSNLNSNATPRYRKYTHRPLNSSPLTGSLPVSNGYHNLDNTDNQNEGRSSPTPSSPLAYNSSTVVGLGYPRDPDPDSPLVQRRRAQYKSRSASAPKAGASSNAKGVARNLSSPSFLSSSGRAFNILFSENTNTIPEDPQKAFLRERFKRRCFERAANAREKAVRERRRGVDDPNINGSAKGKGKRRQIMSSDGFEDDGMGMDEGGSEEEGDEEIMQDELFRRIMANVNRKTVHSYKVSYALEVGSSFDPDMEDAGAWEEELQAPPGSSSTSGSSSSTIHHQPSPFTTPRRYQHLSSSHVSTPEYNDLWPADLEDAELEAYAEECARLMDEQAGFEVQGEQQAGERANVIVGRGNTFNDGMAGMEGLEDVPHDELFAAWSEGESDGEGLGEDVNMDMDLF